MKFSIAHARGSDGVWLDVDMPEPITIAEALKQSPLLDLYPDLDLNQHKVGIFGKCCPQHTLIAAGDRVEIYLPLERELDADDEEED